MKRTALWIVIYAMLALTGITNATQSENTGIRVLPAPGTVTIDGKAGDWDLSGGLLIVDDAESQRDKLGVWVFSMHDAHNLYLLAHFLDETPLNNPGQTIADYGFAGDSLQMRFILASGTPNERTSHWTMWRGSDARDVMELVYGKQFNEGGLKDAKEKGAQQAFLKDADGKGYIHEIAIPWALLTKDGVAPAAGASFVMTAEPNFTVGINGRMSIKDIFKPGVSPDRVFTFMASSSWGPAHMLAKGRVAPGPERLADGRLFPMKLQNGWPVIDWTGLIRVKELSGFKPLTFTMPQDGYISLNLYAPDGTVARQLLNQAFYTKGEHTVQWDGLTTPNWTTPGQPVAPGDYTWRALTHTGMGLKLRGWAANGGKAPWDNGPGTNWGGDHGQPIAAAADKEQVYLGWSFAEAGKALVATDKNGQGRWSNSRSGMSGLTALAADNATVYVLSGEGGTFLYKLNPANGRYQTWGDSTDADLQIKSIWTDAGKPDKAAHIAAHAGVVYLSFPGANLVAALDGNTGKMQKTYAIPAPDALAIAGERLLAVSGGKAVVACNLKTAAVTTLIDGLQAAQALAVGADGRIYVGLGAPAQQVKVFTADGKAAGIIGRPGGRALLGKWTPDGFFNITGLAVDADGKLWAAENDETPKRMSAWNTQTGKLVSEFFGPTAYGALGGAICPDDTNYMVGQGCEWKIDPATGRAACTAVITRAGMSTSRFSVGNNGRVYLATAANWAFNVGPLTIYERVGEADYRLRTVIYYANAEGNEIPPTGHGQHNIAQKTMIWSDANGDGQRQPEEISSCAGEMRFSGWYMGYGPDMSLYSGSKQFRLAGFTACGAPQYDLTHPTVMPSGGLGSGDGRFVMINGDYGANSSWNRCYDIATGKQAWTYPDNFVGVHGSHNAVPPQTGMIRGSYEPCGSVKLPEPIGNAWVITTNVGEWHILTQDGFYLTRLFQGDPLKVRWPAEAVPGADMTDTPSGVGGEDFGGSVTLGTDGKLYVQSGKTGFWNLEVTGLDTVRALPGAKIAFTAKDVQQAQAMREQQLQAALGKRIMTAHKLTPKFSGNLEADFPGGEIVKFQKQDDAAARAVATWDDQNLYLGWVVKDNTPWANSANDVTAMYLSGDTVDFQLGADVKADPNRGEAVLGDLRLSIGNFQGNATVLIYRKVSAVKKQKFFSSGIVKSYPMDFVDVIADAKIVVNKHGDGYTVEAAVPLVALGISPADGLLLLGDFGVTHGDPAGGRTRLRSYWSNQHTGIVDDAVFELQMEPKNWGEIAFKQ